MAQITASELATELDTDARTIRKFLRSVTPKENQPGKGSRWNFEKKSLRTLRKQFSTWTAERTPEVPADENENENEVATDES
jgi:phage terminase Nu1 subunit (DNA packaging protein)